MNWNSTVKGYKIFANNIFTFLCALMLVVGILYLGMDPIYKSILQGEVKRCELAWGESGWKWQVKQRWCFVQTDDGRWLTESAFKAWLAGRNKETR